MGGGKTIVKTYRIVIFIGIGLYAASFFLTAVRGSGGLALAGYNCAWVTLLTPWGSDGLSMLRENPFDFFATLLSGWINLVFLVTAGALLIRPNSVFVRVLRVALLLMFPACWLVFYKEHLHPGEGYFLWIAGMLLVLFANKLAKTPVSATS
jgi:hypothetical protein